MAARLARSRVLTSGQWKAKGRGTVAPPSAGPRFFGDPGAGKVFVGATVYTGSMGQPDGLAWLNDRTGIPHLLSRRYYTDANFWSRSTIAADQAAGRIPFPSQKLMTSSATSIASGAADATIDAEAAWAAGQGYRMFSSYFHEPPDDFPSDSAAADFRAAFRRIVTRFRAAGATNVLWAPILSAPWDFQLSGGEAARGGWWKWDPDWKGTKSGGNGRTTAADFYIGSQAVCDLFAFDQYSPMIGGSNYAEFSGHLSTALNRMVADGRTVPPWTVPEFGTKGANGMPSDGWTGYYKRAFRFMRDNNGIGFVTYNTDGNNFATGTDAAARLAGYAAALASEAAYLLTVRPAL